MPPPELLTEIVGEILLRLPPDDPACLVRASLVCKPWRLLVSEPAFCRRYRAFHRAAPLLGFLHNHCTAARTAPRFVSTIAPSPFPFLQPALDYDNWRALDCRHGRVLVDISDKKVNLVVWDPITGDRQGLPEPPMPLAGHTAAVLCAVRGCDHLDCHSGPFLVVLAGFDTPGRVIRAHMYSSEAGAWNASAHLGLRYHLTQIPSALIRDDIFFVLTPWDAVLRYNLGNNCLSIIHPPMAHEIPWGIALMPVEDGSLGLAGITGSRLCLWSRNVDAEEVARWLRCRVIELERLTTIVPCGFIQVVGSVEGFGVIVVSTDAGVFTIELKSDRKKKVGERGSYFTIFPFRSFYTPGDNVPTHSDNSSEGRHHMSHILAQPPSMKICKDLDDDLVN